MADIIDDANNLADFFLGQSLLLQQRRGTIAPRGTGACLSCGTPLADDRRWCDADCRDDWEKQRKRGVR